MIRISGRNRLSEKIMHKDLERHFASIECYRTPAPCKPKYDFTISARRFTIFLNGPGCFGEPSRLQEGLRARVFSYFDH
jgi:hypothetical protein